MKKYSSVVRILSLACAGLLAACATNQPGAATAPPPNSGHVIINRVANFGSNLSLVVSVDGKDVGSFTEGQNYDGYFPAAHHRLTARVNPNPAGKRRGEKPLLVKAGQTYPKKEAGQGEK